jgi:hypothetical protein
VRPLDPSGPPQVVLIVRGSSVLISYGTGAASIGEQGTDCLSKNADATVDPYTGLADAGGPYMSVIARTTKAALFGLRPHHHLLLSAVPSRKDPSYAPATCQRQGGHCTATTLLKARILVTATG